MTNSPLLIQVESFTLLVLLHLYMYTDGIQLHIVFELVYASVTSNQPDAKFSLFLFKLGPLLILAESLLQNFQNKINISLIVHVSIYHL